MYMCVYMQGKKEGEGESDGWWGREFLYECFSFFILEFCSTEQRVIRRYVTYDRVFEEVFCTSTTVVWTIASDLCNASSYVPYDRCANQVFCHVDRSDYLHRGHTYACCHGGACYDITSKCTVIV